MPRKVLVTVGITRTADVIKTYTKCMSVGLTNVRIPTTVCSVKKFDPSQIATNIRPTKVADAPPISR
jgi:hypothetical protein